ncbi:hypothetical protein G6M50_06245 [Agrobacterium rhizogenes]|nr:hypothetical protein [Rhizobium rhizogenes]NTJ77403.1 hypothetical protein [Rhizobium rhizogenes]
MNDIPSDILEDAYGVLGNGPEYMLPDYGVNTEALVLAIAKAIVAERKATALRLADWIETQRKDIPAHGWEFANTIRDICDLDSLRVNPSLSDRQYLEKIADQVIARNQPKAETSREATPIPEAGSGADASKVVCPALIDDIGGGE